MKKRRLITGLALAFVFGIGLASCNNSGEQSTSTVASSSTSSTSATESEIKVLDLYVGQTKSLDDYSIMFIIAEEATYEDNNLELGYTLKITNTASTTKSLSISNYTVFGNDEDLKLTTYSDYNPENVANSTVRDALTKELSSNEVFNLTNSFVIKHGNADAKFHTTFTLNGATIYVNLYNEGTKTVFAYVHNPSLNQKVLDDAVENDEAVYGYSPSESGRLSSYVKYAWTNPEEVAKYKKEREAYIGDVNVGIKELETELKAAGKTIEEVARACSAKRNELRIESYVKNNNTEGLASLKESNLKTYGHEDGPTPDELYTKYGTWEKVLEKCYSMNAGMDACCGLYDKYFDLYNL